VVRDATVAVSTRNVPVVEPAGIVTVAGTFAMSGFVLSIRIVAPPVGAAALNVSVPIGCC
jgi:hypothetical protein